MHQKKCSGCAVQVVEIGVACGSSGCGCTARAEPRQLLSLLSARLPKLVLQGGLLTCQLATGTALGVAFQVVW